MNIYIISPLSKMSLEETRAIYLQVIEKSITELCRQSDIRGDVADALRRRWTESTLRRLNDGRKGTSDPSSVSKRSLYLTRPDKVQRSDPSNQETTVIVTGSIVPLSKSSVAPLGAAIKQDERQPSSSLVKSFFAESADEFEDEFGDAQVHHATEQGRREAEQEKRERELEASRRAEKRRREEQVMLQKEEKLSGVVWEELGQDLADSDPMEPTDCGARIFAQTEVCDVAGKRTDSRWLVVLLNGILKIPGRGEWLFRSARQTFEHWKL